MLVSFASNSLLLSLAAALSFTTGGVFMEMSDGLSKPLPTALLYGLFGLGASFQTLAMNKSEMGITYILVIGLEVILAVLFSVFFFKEGYSWAKFWGIILVTAGVILLRS